MAETATEAQDQAEQASTGPDTGPDEKAGMHSFTCPTCDNSFTAKGLVAVCNGINVRADEHGNPRLDADGNLQLVDARTGESAVDERGILIPTAGHPSTTMVRGGVK